MASEASSAEQIQREMREVRAELRGNVRDLVQQASGLTDWQEYVKAYPWLSVGAAALVGYLLVPGRSTVAQPNAKEILELAKSQKIALQVEPTRPGIVGSLVGMGVNMLMQTGMSVLMQQLEQLQAPAPSAHHESHRRNS